MSNLIYCSKAKCYVVYLDCIFTAIAGAYEAIVLFETKW